ncbi:MAG: hypothetical protein F6K30_28170 [Cyanothece sp. SIO2G6]|nr:hypothetical protein [Cyanothece sp. SIO2G6]
MKSDVNFFRNRWCRLVLSTERMNRNSSIEVVKILYSLIGESKPEIFLCDSPEAAINQVSSVGTYLSRRIEKKIRKPLRDQLEKQVSRQVIEEVRDLLLGDSLIVEGNLEKCIETKLGIRKAIKTNYWLVLAAVLDFSVHKLGVSCDKVRMNLVCNMASKCGWILPYSGLCIICDRPTKIVSKSFDDGKCLHSDEGPAVQFSDGFSLNVHYGELVD